MLFLPGLGVAQWWSWTTRPPGLSLARARRGRQFWWVSPRTPVLSLPSLVAAHSGRTLYSTPWHLSHYDTRAPTIYPFRPSMEATYLSCYKEPVRSKKRPALILGKSRSRYCEVSRLRTGKIKTLLKSTMLTLLVLPKEDFIFLQ